MSSYSDICYDTDYVIGGMYCPFCNSESVVRDAEGYFCTDCMNSFDYTLSDPVDVWREDGERIY